MSSIQLFSCGFLYVGLLNQTDVFCNSRLFEIELTGFTGMRIMNYTLPSTESC